MRINSSKVAGSGRAGRDAGFTLFELLIVVAIIVILSSILLPALSKSKVRAQGAFCLNNTKQLTVAWIIYADDHNGVLAYNLGADATNSSMSLNWADNVLDWTTSNPDNTNAAKLVNSGLGPYANKTANVYRCPADHVLGANQQQAGWSGRVRSYSMNAMVGDSGYFTQNGYNSNNPQYVQFFKYSTIPKPSDIFAFLDEHPDSINDGYFLNNADEPQWHDLPASYHDGATSFSFADGHSEVHHWVSARTMPPSQPYAAHLPIKLMTKADLQDFSWVISAMSVPGTSGYHY